MTKGQRAVYSDLAIETCLALRLVFGVALRQTEGFVCQPDLAVERTVALARGTL